MKRLDQVESSGLFSDEVSDDATFHGQSVTQAVSLFGTVIVGNFCSEHGD